MATISFGQALVAAVINRAMRVSQQCDLLLAVGTSLQVYPAAGVVPLARSSGARLVIVNAEPTPFDESAAAVFHGPIGDVLPLLCSATAAAGLQRLAKGQIESAGAEERMHAVLQRKDPVIAEPRGSTPYNNVPMRERHTARRVGSTRAAE